MTCNTIKNNALYLHKITQIIQDINEIGEIFTLQNSNHKFGLKKLKTKKIDLSSLNNILEFNPTQNYIEVESFVKIKQILTFLRKNKYTLPVIPDMDHLTMGGIISGIGGGSKSFKNGFFHDIMIDCDLLLPNGEIKYCSKTINSELFYSIPNTLGTIGYITKIKLKIIKYIPYVHVTNLKFNNQYDYFNKISEIVDDNDIDYLEGTIFSPTNFVLMIGRSISQKPHKIDNFINNKIYWQSIQEENEHYFKTNEYIYRWDTDLYYTSINDFIPPILKNTTLRKFIPKFLINPIRDLVPKLGIKTNIDMELIVQDVLIPIDNSNKFFNWYKKKIKLYPVYICPGQQQSKEFNFFDNKLFIDFGIGYGVFFKENNDLYCKLIEQKMLELNGLKFLYSKQQMTNDEFWSMYDKEYYDYIRSKYNIKLPDLYTKIKNN